MKNKTPTWIPKVWGGETIFASNDLYCGKILEVKKGHYSSFHRHKKIEDWLIYEGKILLIHSSSKYYKKNNNSVVTTKSGRVLEGIEFGDVSVDSTELILEIGDTYHIPSVEWHLFYALEDSKIFEVSTKDEESERLTESR